VAEEKRKVRRLKKVETVREKAEKASNASPKPRRLHTTAHKITMPIRAAHRIGRKEYYLPLPKNRVGQFLNKRRSFVPKFFKESWEEVRQVTWPSRKETWKLTLAVFIFAITFGLVIAIVDYGLDKLFRSLLLQ
jgi:preprotein translocase subunit SecE